MEIFKLVGNIFVDNEKANKNINETDKKGQGLGKTFQKVGKGAVKVGKVMGVGLGVGVTAMAGLAKKTSDAADRVDKMSQRLGLSRKGFQEWEFVLSQSGVDIDSLQSGMKTLSKRMDEANKGVGKGSELFEQLGVTITDSMSQEEAFEATVAALQDMEDGVEKAAIAQELLGRSGQELLPLLNSTAEATNAMKNEANDLGLVMSDKSIDAGVKFTDTMDKLKRSFSAAFMTVGAELIPVFEKLAAWIVGNLPTIQEVTGKVFKAIGDAIAFVVPIIEEHLVPIFETMFKWVMDNLPEIKRIFMEIFNALYDIVKTFIDLVMVIWDKFGDDIINAAKFIFETLKTAFENFTNFIMAIFNAFKALFKGDWEGFWSNIGIALSVAWQNMKDSLNAALTIMKTAIDLAMKAIKTGIEAIFYGIGSVITTIFEGIVNGIKGAINVIIDLINGFIGKVNSIKIDLPGNDLDWSPSLSKIPRLQVGGEIVQGGRVMVGEAGPEVLDLQAGAKVIPLNKMAPEGGLTIVINADTLVGQNAGDELAEVMIEALQDRGVFA